MNNTKSFKLYVIILTLAGSLPIVAYPLLVELFGKNPAILLGPFLSYIGMIISFLSGTLWANAKAAHRLSSLEKLVFISFSVLITISCWMSFSVLEAGKQLLLYAAAFLVLLLLDITLHKKEHLSRWYYILRVVATIIVVAAIMYSTKFV